MFEKKDLTYFAEKGISKEDVIVQKQNLLNGFPFVEIVRPAIVGDGIHSVDREFALKAMHDFELYKEGTPEIQKFVPASGAASRMFKMLFELLSKLEKSNDVDIFKNENVKSWSVFFENLDKFAFYDDLKQSVSKQGYDIKALIESRKYVIILKSFLKLEGLNYGNLPKGLLKFHKYASENRTPVEEHLVEGALYGAQKDGIVQIHFTVSPEHLELFKEHLKNVQNRYEDIYNVKYSISFSEQKSSTDTVSVDSNDQLFRDSEGCMVFRPGGHGALIENLNDLDCEIVFVKNIDNVVPDRLKSSVTEYKKVLAGILTNLRAEIFYYLDVLEDVSRVSPQIISDVVVLLKERLQVEVPKAFDSWDLQGKANYCYDKLNRPIRVCGMVKNEGEPGGGPFWTNNSQGDVSLQIVEGAQIGVENPEQKSFLESSTHFNPVDLVCCIKNYKGEKFDLKKFIDHSTGFVSHKSIGEISVKALELPGLWNGAMASWITLFVEVPVSTFNPVKVVNDLLRPEHSQTV